MFRDNLNLCAVSFGRPLGDSNILHHQIETRRIFEGLGQYAVSVSDCAVANPALTVLAATDGH